MKNLSGNKRVKKVAIIGNFLPRRCGIATFTTDLTTALSTELKSDDKVSVVAMDDVESGYKYPEPVKFQVRENIQADYFRAAEFLNINQFDLVIVQHEFGIYGGQKGIYLFHLLRNLKMPIITTLHTVLSNPSKEEKSVILELDRYSDKIVVMTEKAIKILDDVYSINNKNISLIPHGIHDVPFVDSFFYKDQLGLENRKVILTFGLLGPSKGIEDMINAMPAIIKKHPSTVYVVLGITHPNIVKTKGEEYRIGLIQKAKKLGIGNNVSFMNQFVDLESLTHFLIACDVYITPYLSKEQTTSGTLAYALGTGTAVVSTPYWHAEELLADNRGILISFGDSNAMANEIIDLLSDENKRNNYRKKAYQYCRSMVWKEVSRNYLELAEEIMTYAEPTTKPQALNLEDTKTFDKLPEINLNHLKVLTDNTGILQHANFSIPDRNHGYCIDDNARALIAACMYYDLRKDESVLPLIQTYLAFILHAFNTDSKRFRNFMSFDRKWLEKQGSEDSHGRTIWALGVACKLAPLKILRDLIFKIFFDATDCLEGFIFIRAWAFSIIGIQNYLNVYTGDARAKKIRNDLSYKLLNLFDQNTNNDWLWCEDTLTYANSRIPQALIMAGKSTRNNKMLDKGLCVLEWLLSIQTHPDGYISTIGNENWYGKDGEKSVFDQQPIEIMCLIEACAAAFRATSDKIWIHHSERCFSWFLGQNDIKEPICDFKSGGCHDGVTAHGVNMNMGAESTLAWLISLFTMYKLYGEEIWIKSNQNL